jgi:hypothetical protein
MFDRQIYVFRAQRLKLADILVTRDIMANAKGRVITEF